MDPIKTLFERSLQSTEAFPEELAALYDGSLTFELLPARPLVIANFVSTLDGVVSYALPGHFGGGEISGFNQSDAFIMGLLRASADAVLCGAGSLNADSGHVRTPGFVYPPAQHLYAALRQRLGKPRQEPLTVILSASGQVNLAEANFHMPGVETLIITTDSGAERLHSNSEAGAATYIRSLGAGPRLAPAAITQLLDGEFGARVILNEGGPTIFTSFLEADAIDQLFLTLAPQLAGRDRGQERPSLVNQHAFLPETAPWGQLLTLKQAGNHLYLRYDFTEKDVPLIGSVYGE